MNFLFGKLVNELENMILSDFKSILDDKEFNQQKILKLLTNLVFCITKLISQIPSILYSTQAQLNECNQKIQNIDTELNFLKNSDISLLQIILSKNPFNCMNLLHYAIHYGSLPIVQYYIETRKSIIEFKDLKDQ